MNCHFKLLHILKSSTAREVLKRIQIGLLCVQPDATDRPTMSTIVMGNDAKVIPDPKQPAFYVGSKVLEQESTLDNSKNCSINKVTLSDFAPRS
ncbi:hypothetical protein L6164_037423 [Bauhinia variegata]|uniref:Uncharacterized protein n=1 Tax=Bauhinia variegata TaxID=167791 RepID=A0ACB9KKS5_BAUVA|nr:hypothetical protein L6164_037423 [Bauhinia variegata]